MQAARLPTIPADSPAGQEALALISRMTPQDKCAVLQAMIDGGPGQDRTQLIMQLLAPAMPALAEALAVSPLALSILTPAVAKRINVMLPVQGF